MVLSERNKTTDMFLKKRRAIRQELLVRKITQLQQQEPAIKTGGVSTMNLYHHCFRKGYSYSFQTLQKDLTYLENADVLMKKVFNGGKGKGTRCFWRVA